MTFAECRHLQLYFPCTMNSEGWRIVFGRGKVLWDRGLSFLIYFVSVKNLQARREAKAEMPHMQFVDLLNH